MNLSKLMDRGKVAWDVLRTGGISKGLADQFLSLWRLGAEDSLLEDEITEPYRQHPWIKAAIQAISMAFSRPELILFRNGRRVEKHPFLDLLRRPSPFLSGTQLRQGTTVWQELKGTAVWVLETGVQNPRPSTRIIQIRLVDPSRVKYHLDDSTHELTHWTLDEGKATEQPLAPFEILTFKYFNPYDDMMGLASISAVKRSMNVDHDALRHLQSILRTGATPGTVLVTDKKMFREDSEFVRRRWDQAHATPNKAGRTAILHSGLKPFATAPSARELQLQQLIKGTRDEFAAGMLVPPILLGDYSLANYSNALIQERVLWEWNVIPKINAWLERVNMELLPRFGTGLELRADIRKIQALQRTLTEELGAANLLRTMGVPLAKLEEMFQLGIPGIEDLPWAETWFVPAGMIPAGDLVGPLDGDLADGDPGNSPPAEEPVAGSPSGRPAPRPRPTPVDPVPVILLNSKRLDRKLLARWEVKAASMIRREVRFRRLLSRLFEGMRRDTIRLIRQKWDRLVVRPARGKAPKDPEAARSLAVQFLFDLEEAGNTGQVVLTPEYEATASLAAKEAAVEVGILGSVGAEFEVPAEVLEVATTMPGRVKGFTGTLHNRLREVTSEAIEKGLTEKEAGSLISRHFRLNAFQHAPSIARTETATAFNTTRDRMFKAAGVKRHRWLTSGDELVRESHVRQNGKIVEIGETWDNGLRHPNDFQGSAREIINCRCIAEPIIA